VNITRLGEWEVVEREEIDFLDRSRRDIEQLGALLAFMDTRRLKT